MSNLTDADRSWVVAGLTLGGFTAEDIADRLGCSLRLVRSVRAADMTQVCLIYQREVEAFANQMALADSDARTLRRDLSDMAADRDRIKAQFDRVLDARLVGQPIDTCGQGHLMADWNTYWNAGRRWCRECHASRQRDYRLARKLNLPVQLIRDARRRGDLDIVIENVLRPASTASIGQDTPGAVTV
jgi:hypothetical protein